MMTDIEETEAKKVQSQIEKHDIEEDQQDFSEAAKKLAEGLLSIYQSPLEQVHRELNEITSKQETLFNQMQAENEKLQEIFDDVDLNEMKRALRLQQVKQKEALNREQQREQESQREQDLIGKPVVS
ncbi:biogenesis of lysosomal organelles complex 1 subunit pallidin isoform X2 [Nomia melanderi]|uniref:biogenesis of lysosomal organelles complex 1 subunit pallidin isoform X2 n=1 Tax=Nomia melanderi TaxID=2448451 RepID=UPI001304703F|nr:biogenesis of lysosome-related organelles complex 1 subunit 6-like isoform X2 [Nomia melanderi]